jgi:hypothetical protein
MRTLTDSLCLLEPRYDCHKLLRTLVDLILDLCGPLRRVDLNPPRVDLDPPRVDVNPPRVDLYPPPVDLNPPCVDLNPAWT